MKIDLYRIPIREVAKDYVDNAEEWVVWYSGKLNIRPKYQREFVYDDKKREAVINSVRKNFPLNVMYWMKNEDGTFEILDGQQRTISICQYVNGDYSINAQYFHWLTKDEQDQILNYELMIYFCEWTDKERLDWFEVINFAWEKLTPQELRNAIYTWEWLTDAKRHFSKTWCAAYQIWNDYVKWSAIRQEILETAIDWISDWFINQYMAEHQHNQNANELRLYFQNVINWVKATFPNYRKEMKWVNRWALYNQFKDKQVNTDELEKEIKKLMMDEDVTKKAWIYPYVLTRDEKYLSIRAFTDKMKREAYERQNWICKKCWKECKIEEMEADHITPRSQWWATTAENCQMLCKNCNRTKSDK